MFMPAYPSWEILGNMLAIFTNCAINVPMNSKHRKTLEALFANPVNGNLEWTRIEALLLAVGCQVLESGGSAVTFALAGRKATFHRPHPGTAALKYRVKLAREFLGQLGITP